MPAIDVMSSRQLPPPTWTPSGNRGFHVDLRRAIIPASLGILVVLAFVVHVKPWILVLASLVVPLFYAGSAWYVHRNLKPFEAAFNGMLTRGDTDGLWRLYRDARGLRLLAPAWVMHSKLGLILSLRGEHKAANGILEEAYELSPKVRRADLLGPLARTKYQLGDFEALQALASQWRARSLFPGAANLYLAAAYVEDPREDSSQAIELLDEIRGGLGTEETELAEKLRARIG